MGVPINSYSFLKSILNECADVDSLQESKKLLENFNLFAFILYDPKEHFQFYQKLEKSFETLDTVSSDKLLFFTIVNPPSEWHEYQDYWQKDPNNPFLAWYNGIKTKAKDDDTTAHFIASQLNIPFESLPCIVITPNLKFNNFHWISTNKASLEDQIATLGKIARKGMKYEELNNRWNFLLDEIKNPLYKPLNNLKESNIGCSLAKALADVVSAFVTHTDLKESKEAFIQFESVLSDIKIEIKKIKEELNKGLYDLDEEQYILEQLDKFYVAINYYLSTQNKNEITLPINKKYLEHDSYLMLKTSYKVIDYLSDDDDFTSSVICLAKCFENEVNMSLVHWIRSNIGIDLPTYFNKFQSGINGEIKSGKLKPNFNKLYRNTHDKLLHPALFQSQIVLKKQINNSLPDGWARINSRFFLDSWENIAEIRNSAAHTELINHTTALNMQDYIKKLSNLGIFSYLYKIKKSFKGY
ncbi:hypothetical protein [Neobacillus vireti]|uniref:hypothetical protein n=1 Tax=Neobacillus vireti TaxID=220686 RepID=UPI002FFE8886